MDRDQTVALATSIRNQGKALLPKDGELVVVVTDAEGNWVGVSATTGNQRTAQILESALLGADYRAHLDGRG